jgi:DNA polymerase III alpha subunit
MNHLRIRSEFSFRRAFGSLDAVIAAAGGTAMGLTDGGTWGHVQFSKAAKKSGIRPIYGVELLVVPNAKEAKNTKQPGAVMAFLARSEEGLTELYQLVSLANQQFFYQPRLDYRDVEGISDQIVVLSGVGADLGRLPRRPTIFLEVNPSNTGWNRQVVRNSNGRGIVVCCDNAYPKLEDRVLYEVVAGINKNLRTTPQHILDEDELRMVIPEATDEMFQLTDEVSAMCAPVLPRAEMVVPEKPAPLYEMCIRGARARGLPVYGPASDTGAFELGDPEYQRRLMRELDMIESKGFEDYFYVISDMVQKAKEMMLVGPARGSSAGSLVCFLLGITDVDPIKHDLMFERFIDVTRADLPDVDIDFQDTRRELIFDYMREKYGPERVGRIGTVSRFQAKSCITAVAMELNIPEYELKVVKDAMIERSSGDARAAFCVMDTFETLDVGKALIEKYPGLKLAGQIEGHASNSGQHAAGIIVSQYPIERYCSRDRSGAQQIDKKDAEVLNMLKIDALGLRTLSVIQDTLEQIKKDREWLINYPLDDTDAFEIFNAERFQGIFQYEGYALQTLTKQMKIKNFDDIAVITALARPGPLHCGAATEFIERRIGRVPVAPLHPLAEPLTRSTYGVVIYQEQVMAIGRVIGQLSWEDVSELRKAMSKSLGDEFFNKYWEKFEAGAAAQGINSQEARRIWDRICTFGSWAFNKSHAISYGLISYWCAVLKAHYPLEFAAACLRNAKDDDQAVGLLRDLVREGFQYTPVDSDKSDVTWSVVDGKLLGGLTNVKGIGEKKALDILARRRAGQKLLPGQAKLLMFPKTPFDDLFEAERRFGDMYANPKKYKVTSGPIIKINEIGDEVGDYVFIARMRERNQRDLNEYQSLVKRGGRVIHRNNLFLNLVLEDDTGTIIARVGRYDYQKWGKPLIEAGQTDTDWYLWKGRITDPKWRVVNISQWRKLT